MLRPRILADNQLQVLSATQMLFKIKTSTLTLSSLSAGQAREGHKSDPRMFLTWLKAELTQATPLKKNPSRPTSLN